jgi:2-iminobutanoate/2-iminopropanoate deaminase
MSTKVSFNATGVPRMNNVIPQAVIAGGFVSLSGMAGMDPATCKLIEGDFETQARQAFKNIQIVLEETGSSMDKVVKTTLFMVAGADPAFEVVNKLYSEFFPNNPPARSAPQLMPFPGPILISIECIALA